MEKSWEKRKRSEKRGGWCREHTAGKDMARWTKRNAHLRSCESN